jgi:hypothetical protein
MKPEDMVKELWSLGNTIAGFSVAQSLAFAVALGSNLAGLQSQSLRVKTVLAIICSAFGAAYSFGVWRCLRLALSLPLSIDEACKAVWFQVTYGRIICIWLFTIISVFGLFAPEIFRKQKPTP